MSDIAIPLQTISNIGKGFTLICLNADFSRMFDVIKT